jgi:hypothetical protein
MFFVYEILRFGSREIAGVSRRYYSSISGRGAQFCAPFFGSVRAMGGGVVDAVGNIDQHHLPRRDF